MSTLEYEKNKFKADSCTTKKVTEDEYAGILRGKWLEEFEKDMQEEKRIGLVSVPTFTLQPNTHCIELALRLAFALGELGYTDKFDKLLESVKENY